MLILLLGVISVMVMSSAALSVIMSHIFAVHVSENAQLIEARITEDEELTRMV